MIDSSCPGANPVRHTCTVLLVDDDPVIRALVTIALNRPGFKVIQTCNGEEALEFVEANLQPPIDLLITDMIMPRIGGNELASRLQAINPGLRVIYCSGYLREQVVQNQPRQESIRFLHKPFTNQELLKMVQEVLE